MGQLNVPVVHIGDLDDLGRGQSLQGGSDQLTLLVLWVNFALALKSKECLNGNSRSLSISLLTLLIDLPHTEPLAEAECII
jgi:hypothetical protein